MKEFSTILKLLMRKENVANARNSSDIPYFRSCLLLDKHSNYISTKPKKLQDGRDVAQAVNHRLRTRKPGLQPRSGPVGFVVDKAALG
jgi:hypothetical protein